MNAADSAVLPLGEMEDRDVTESDQELWIATRPIEVQAFCDGVGTFAASRGEDCPHVVVAKGGIDVRQALIVCAGEITDLAESMFAEVHF
jgi:hypothetical protein